MVWIQMRWADEPDIWRDVRSLTSDENPEDELRRECDRFVVQKINNKFYRIPDAIFRLTTR